MIEADLVGAVTVVLDAFHREEPLDVPLAKLQTVIAGLDRGMTPQEYLKLPYHRVIRPDEDAFMGQIIEFPGCICTGATPSETASLLEDVAESWLEATLAQGQHVPDPLGDNFLRDLRRVLSITPAASVVRR